MRVALKQGRVKGGGTGGSPVMQSSKLPEPRAVCEVAERSMSDAARKSTNRRVVCRNGAAVVLRLRWMLRPDGDSENRRSGDSAT